MSQCWSSVFLSSSVSFRPMCHPSNHSCQYPWLSPACGTYSSKLTFQLLYSAWLLRSWTKRQNGPCYQHGKFMITNPLPGLQCRLGGCLCFQSMALFSGFMTNSTLPSVPSLSPGNSLREKIYHHQSHQKEVHELGLFSCKLPPRACVSFSFIPVTVG